MKRLAFALLSSALLGLVGASGCTTSSFCFDDCGDQDGGGGTSGSNFDGGGGNGGLIDAGGDGGTGNVINVDGGDGGGCKTTNNGVEICDGLDNDCNGKVDENADFTSTQTCGTCDNNCAAPPHVINPTCVPPAKLDGKTPGTCKYEKCEQDWYEINGDPKDGCEYNCPWNPNGTNTTDPGGVDGCGKDDDCDGTVDEDLNTCDDTENCGKCGLKCVVPNGTPKCTTSAPTGTQCTTANTKCEIAQCDAGYYDNNKSPDDGCEYKCPVATPGPEICDGIDNDCDGKIDNADSDLETQDPDVGDSCFGGTQGLCISSAHQGLKKCIGGQITCCDPDSNTINSTNPNLPPTGVRNGVCDAPTGNQVLKPGDVQETCNNIDDDCDGTPDDSPIDEGGTCGVSVGNCQTGTEQCQSGALVCVGKVDPTTDICNGQDDDCDGVIDGVIGSGTPQSCTQDSQCSGGKLCLPRSGPSDKVCATPPGDAMGDCNVPTPPPPGVSQPCKKGTLSCVGGVKSCIGSIGPTSTSDKCGEDSNCDGVLNGQPDLQNDVKNCGSCGNDCTQLSPNGHGVWACQSGACVRTGCEANFINCDGNNNDCEKFCSFVSANEQCNGIDDNCNCQVDENITNKPSPVQVCGVSPAATDSGCTSGVNVACTSGSWNCTFPSGYCTGTKPDYCTATVDTCDSKDNNCNGAVDENFKPPVLNQGYVGQPCASDDGLPPPGHGACKGVGTYQCATASSTACNAVKDNSKVSAELCDNVDNDCDGVVDESYQAKGTNTTYWVKPAVTRLASNLWVYQYEASRPGATNVDPGSGNGYHTSAPTGVPLDQTQSCSVAGVVPWFNVTPVEAAQTCAARGGRLCTTADWQTACHATANCKYGYNPRTGACNQPGTYTGTATRVCNIGPFDFDGNASNGITDGLLPTASGALANCWADWSGLQSNSAAQNNIRDIMGNLREITYNPPPISPNGCNQSASNSTCLFTLMGGAFNTQAEDGASCDFTFFTVDAQYKLFDVGYRCCFDQNPS
ncbi:MAG: hypothetical protein H6717_38440 [Polyangiaceae bacterium]|nr:hypothetical protein [Polyangiaceae bacterium]